MILPGYHGVRTATKYGMAVVACLTCAFVLACEKGVTQPPGALPKDAGPALTVMSQLVNQDTIEAGDTIFVRLLDDDGIPAKSSPIVVSLRPDSVQAPGFRVSGGVIQPGSSYVVNTNADGIAAIVVRHASVAGTNTVRIVAQNYQLVAYATFVTLPGKPIGFRIDPEDVVLFVGGTRQLTASLADRNGSLIQVSATFVPESDVASVSTSGRVTGLKVGVQRVIATTTGTPSPALTDDVTVWVAPPGTVASVATPTTYDGVGARTASTLGGGSAQPLVQAARHGRWQPGTDRLFYVDSMYRLNVREADGRITAPALPSFTSVQWPDFSPDGQWLYFTGVASGVSAVYRSRPDGDEMTRLTHSDSAINAGPSPDGKKVAYSNERGVRVLDVATGSLSWQVVSGGTTLKFHNARYSPDGKWLAYVNQGRLSLRELNGLWDVAKVTDWEPGLTWSPDSNWIIGYSTSLKSAVILYMPLREVRPLPGVGKAADWKR